MENTSKMVKEPSILKTGQPTQGTGKKTKSTEMESKITLKNYIRLKNSTKNNLSVWQHFKLNTKSSKIRNILKMKKKP